MATQFTTPRTTVSGEVYTAANANVHLRDNMEYAAGATKPSFRIFRSTDQTGIASGVTTAITFDSERYDTQALHSTGVNTSRVTFTAGTAGLWSFGAGALINPINTTGVRQAFLRLNGSTLIAAWDNTTPSAANADRFSLSTEYRVVAGDFLELVVVQSSGSAATVAATANYSPEMWGHWIGA